MAKINAGLLVIVVGLLLGLVWVFVERQPPIAETTKTTHRLSDLRLTCIEFRWYVPGNKQVYPPQFVCQSDLTLIQTLIAAAYLAEINTPARPNLVPPTERSN